MFRSLVFIVAMVSVALAGAACDTDSARKEMVLRVQSLRNLHPQGKADRQPDNSLNRQPWRGRT